MPYRLYATCNILPNLSVSIPARPLERVLSIAALQITFGASPRLDVSSVAANRQIWILTRLAEPQVCILFFKLSE